MPKGFDKGPWSCWILNFSRAVIWPWSFYKVVSMVFRVYRAEPTVSCVAFVMLLSLVASRLEHMLILQGEMFMDRRKWILRLVYQYSGTMIIDNSKCSATSEQRYDDQGIKVQFLKHKANCFGFKIEFCSEK